MAIKESNVTINVKDLDKAISFYESIGLTTKNRWKNHYAQMVAPGIVIGLHPSSKHTSHHSGTISIGFTTDNFDETKALLMKHSIPLTEPQEEGGQFLHFTDPDGTAIYFIKPNWK